MARSDKTIAEFEAAAMLLGLRYDPDDHTFMGEDCGDLTAILDADTMEPLPLGSRYFMKQDEYTPAIWTQRKQAVRRGEIGAADVEDYYGT